MSRCGDQIVTSTDLRNYARYDEHGTLLNENVLFRMEYEKRLHERRCNRVINVCIVLAWTGFWIWMAAR